MFQLFEIIQETFATTCLHYTSFFKVVMSNFKFSQIPLAILLMSAVFVAESISQPQQDHQVTVLHYVVELLDDLQIS